MKKILSYIYNEKNWFKFNNTQIITEVLDKSGNNISYSLYIKQRLRKDINYRYIYLVNLVPLFQALISLIIFTILYILDIQLLSNNVIYIAKVILFIWFFMYILRYLDLYTTLYYCHIDDYTEEDVMLGFNLRCKLINFIINFVITLWLLNFSIDELIQYNIIIVINWVVMRVFSVYKNVYDYEINGEKITTYFDYPWILVISTTIMLLLGIKKINLIYRGLINTIFNEYSLFTYFGKEEENLKEEKEE